MSTDPEKKANKFSIEIVNTGNTNIVSVGLVPEDYMSNAAPGWFDGSVGYHGDDGGIYIENGFPTKTTTPLKKGEKMSVEVYKKEGKTVGCFKRNKEKYFELKLDDVGKVFYPCLAMRSRGAAAKLLSDRFWISDKSSSETHKDIPTLRTWKREEGIFISSADPVLKRKKDVCRGLISIYNPTRDTILFKVQYKKSQTDDVEGILAHRRVWAAGHEVKQDDLRAKITVEWIKVGDDKKEKYRKGECSLEKLKSESSGSRTYSFEIDGRPMDGEQMIGDQSRSESPDSDNEEDERSMEESSITDSEISDTSKSDQFDVYYEGHTGPKDYSYTGLMKILMQARWNITAANRQIYYASPPFCLPLLKSVEQILEKMKDYDLNEIEEGATPLHYAVQLGSYQLVTLLLERKAIPNFKDKSGYLPLELAIWSDETNEKDEIATALVKGMSRRRVVELFWNWKDRRHSCKIKDLVEKKLIETTKAVLDHFKDPFEIDYLVAPLELDDKARCPTEDEYEVKDVTAYQVIGRENLEELANHECLKSLTEYKWITYGRCMFLLSFLLYFIFWVALTTAVVTGVMAEDAMTYDKPVDYARVVCEFAALGYAGLTLFGEALQFYLQGCMKYLADPYNYVDVTSSLLIICVLPLRLSDCDAQWGVFAVGYIIWTIRSIKFLTVFRGLGLLGHLIIQLIIHDVLKFALFYLVILFAFSGGLFLSFKGDGDLDVHNETSTFWGILFVGVRVLIEGQPFLDYTGPNGYKTFSCIIMLIFLASTCVVMLNIFIAQLSNRYNDSTKVAKKRFESHRVATIAKLERGDDLTSIILFFRCCTPLWIKHFREEVYTYELQRRMEDTAVEKLRHWCRFLKCIVPCWIYRKKCRDTDFLYYDSDVSDCESNCEDFCKKQCYCLPTCCMEKCKDVDDTSKDGPWVSGFEESMGVMIDSQLPYLVAMDDDILSTGICTFHLEEGETLIGREDADREQDIVLPAGPNIEKEHCFIQNLDGGVTLVPNLGAMCAVQDLEITEPTRLSHGDYIVLGGSQVFRFNNPTGAATA